MALIREIDEMLAEKEERLKVLRPNRESGRQSAA
jgi:hypothetical protein